jgi:hypothetical protein
MNQETLQKIVEKWKDENLELVSPYSVEQVQKNFDKIGKLVSKDILQIYTTFGGIADENIDSNLLSFWTLEQLVVENSSRKSDFILFGDFLIFSHLYGYKYENKNISSVYSDFETGEFLKISESVEEFFHLYLTNPREIGLYKE